MGRNATFRWADAGQLLLPLLLLLTAGAGRADPAPDLRVFADGMFEPGLWHVTPIGAGARARMPDGQRRCLASPEALIHAGLRISDNNGCSNTVTEDRPERAVVAYQCRGRGSGYSVIRRIARNQFVVEVQGVSESEPFAMRGEYRRAGDCPKRARR